MTQATRIHEGIGGNRWMAQAGIGVRRRSIGSSPNFWNQARDAGVLADIGNVPTRAALESAQRDYLAVHDPEGRKLVEAGASIQEVIGAGNTLRVTRHGGELLVSMVANDDEITAASLADEVQSIVELPSQRELVAAGNTTT